MEKPQSDGDAALPEPSSRSGWWSFWRRYGGLIFSVVFGSQISLFLFRRHGPGVWPYGQANVPLTSPSQDFHWSTLATVSHLNYVECYDGFQCARLQIPLDHFNSSVNQNISIALVKLPAVVPVTDPSYGGAILFNPGGPGGSGVGFVVGAGLALRAVLDARPGTSGKHFDLIGFDPRGVGLTEPSVDCHGDPAGVRSWWLRTIEEGLLTSSDAALGRLWSMNAAQWESCGAASNDDILHYMSTSSVATDMLHIIEAHGQWREREATRLSRKTKTTVQDELKYKPGKEQLQYWGFSYGTFLGSTFSSMYPERVNRVILDGVVDADDYSQNLWYNNLVDTEKAMDAFYQHCARVGFPLCPLATFNRTTKAEDVKTRVQSIINRLYHSPLPVMGQNPDIITWSDVRGLIFGSLYFPAATWPLGAYLLSRLEQDDGVELAQYLQPAHTVDCASSTPNASVEYANYAGAIILCGDGDLHSYGNKTAFEEHVRALTALSPTGGDVWAGVVLPCRHFPLRPQHRYTGPWAGNTSHPLLWIGNTADPVTPVASARKMAQGFDGSVVLTQDSPGHCSIAAFSKCTTDYVHDYFQTGTLPPHGKVCSSDQLPWGPAPGGDMGVSVETELGIQGHLGIAKALHHAGGGLGKPMSFGRLEQTMFP